MPELPLQTYLIPLALIAALLVVLLVLRLRAAPGGAAGATRRLRVAEGLSLGGRDRAMIVEADGQAFLVVATSAGAALHPVGGRS